MHRNQGIGLGVDLQEVALGELHPDELAGEGPGDRVAGVTIGQEAIKGDFACLLLDADVTALRERGEGRTVLRNELLGSNFEGPMDSCIDLLLKGGELSEQIGEAFKGTAGNEVSLQIIERLLDLALAPGMPGQRAGRLKAVMTAEAQVACVPLEVGPGGMQHEDFGVVRLHTVGDTAGGDQAVLQSFQDSALVFGQRSIIDAVAAEAVDVAIDKDPGECTGNQHRVQTPVKLRLFTGLGLVRHERARRLHFHLCEQCVQGRFAAGVPLGAQLLQDAGAAEVLLVGQLGNCLAERIQPAVDPSRPVIGGGLLSPQSTDHGVGTDTDEPSNLARAHLRVLSFKGLDGYPIFHCDHLSSSLLL